MKEWSARGDCALPLRKTKDVLCFKYITWWQHMKKTISDDPLHTGGVARRQSDRPLRRWFGS